MGPDGGKTAIGSMNHLAITVPLEKFDAIMARLRKKGVTVCTIDHDDQQHGNTEVWVRSMYFKDPNGIHMEFSANTRPYEPGDIYTDPLNAKGETVKRGGY